MKGELDPATLTTYETQDAIYFWSAYSPLSNFNQNFNITLDKVIYNCVEQAYCARKAKHFQDYSAVDKIMRSKDPIEMKRTRIAGYKEDQWAPLAEGTMKEILETKVIQNYGFKEYLIKTRPKTLCEAVNGDTFWGIGMNALNKDLEQKEKWGKNRLGALLMAIRDAC
jgi:ribA/ribD-fused uncharacterized protein